MGKRIADLEIESEQNLEELDEETRFNIEQETEKRKLLNDGFEDLMEELDLKEAEDIEDELFSPLDEELEDDEPKSKGKAEAKPEGDTKNTDEEKNTEEVSTAEGDYSPIKEKLVSIYGEDSLSDTQSILDSIDKLIAERNEFEGKSTLNEETQQSVDALAHLFEESDIMLQIAKEMKENKLSFEQAFGRVADFEEFKAELKETNPEAYDKMIEEQVLRREKKRQEAETQKSRTQAFKDNQKKAKDNWHEFVKEEELTVEQANTLASKIDNVVGELTSGGMSKDLFKALHVLDSLDDLLAQAKEEGLKDGKNTNINELRSKGRKNGDGLPRLRSVGTIRTGDQKSEDPFFDLAPEPRKRLAEY